MLLALNAFKTASSGPTPSTNRTPIGLLLALTRRGAEVAPPATNRTPIGLLLALTRPAVPGGPPPAATNRTPIGLLLALTRPSVPGEPPIEPPVEIPPPSYAGEIAGSRGRMIRKFRKRKREELEELLDAIGVTPPEVLAVPVPPEVPPVPGLMADVPMPPRTVLRSPPDEDEDEIALLLELIS